MTDIYRILEIGDVIMATIHSKVSITPTAGWSMVPNVKMTVIVILEQRYNYQTKLHDRYVLCQAEDGHRHVVISREAKFISRPTIEEMLTSDILEVREHGQKLCEE